MGKSSNKDKSSTEYYKSIIRQMKKTIKQLNQQLNKSNNNIGIPDSIEPEDVKFETCSKCGKGAIQEIIVANRLINTCSTCDYRSKAVKIDKNKP